MEIHGLSYGNYVHTPEGIKSITGWVKHNITIIHWEGGHCRAALCKPVELTPEILEACGFESVNAQGWVEIGAGYYRHKDIPEFVLTFQSDGRLKYQWHQFFKGTFNKVTLFQYLHELQNIFYNLTGKQLKVNLKEAQEG